MKMRRRFSVSLLSASDTGQKGSVFKKKYIFVN